MTVITRFAPSPTGFLHVGNIRTALVNWLVARANNGKFILRIDDTDQARSKQEYVDAIKEDMGWLGLNWDELYFQSQRMELYEQAKERLIKAGRLYPCFETVEELEIKKKVLLGRNLPPIYDRTALNLSESEKEALIAKGLRPHWRFLMKQDEIKWHDGVRGEIVFDPFRISDPILIRADGTMTYMIATVVDDIALNVTNIIRGEDHITNSAVHVQMFEALGGKSPEFAHLSLLKSKEGGISKREGGFDIRSLRADGIQPMAILSFLAKLGSSDPIEYRKTIDELVNEFSLKKFSKATANYDIADVERLNTKLVHNLEYNEARAFLPNYVDEAFWNRVRANIKTIPEAVDWWNICMHKIKPVITDANFIQEALNVLPDGVWDSDTWLTWVKRIKEKTGRGGKELFMPIRLALTGMEYGPELQNLLLFLGREKVYARLHGEIA